MYDVEDFVHDGRLEAFVVYIPAPLSIGLYCGSGIAKQYGKRLYFSRTEGLPCYEQKTNHIEHLMLELIWDLVLSKLDP